MKVVLKENQDMVETTIEILYKEVTQDMLNLERHIQLFSKTLLAKQHNEFVQVLAKDIQSIEVDDRKTWIHTENCVLETDFRLFELEEHWIDDDFIRASKSTLINLQKIERLAPEFNRMMVATMKNKEKIYISRQYAKQLKDLLKRNSGNKGGKQ